MAAASEITSAPTSNPTDILIPDGGGPSVDARGSGTTLSGAGEPRTQTDEESGASAGRLRQRAWQQAQDLHGADQVVKARVCGFNKGGLLVEWQGLSGFVPASQLLDLEQLHLEGERFRQLEERQGEILALKIIEVEPDAERLILSERATEVSASAREDLFQELESGQIRSGEVTNLADFGAFVDLGGAEGLVHISELSWRRLKHPSDVVKPGQEVKVLILSVDAERERIALSRKQLRQDPWLGVEDRYQPRQTVQGTVTNLVDFGAFVLVEEGLEGLIHISQMGVDANRHPDEILKKGDLVEASVLRVSEQKRRLALRLQGHLSSARP